MKSNWFVTLMRAVGRALLAAMRRKRHDKPESGFKA
ncbi:hypothetical protein STRATTON_173 [Erwinia phage vB_EamM_Stratton]|uniref:Uncharacterized protein n=1 Tax=Erwinia phage vB_EamM_Stratton TaxID=1883378 RepID=A0A1B2IH65_9CAUD|nr:hypothetical protein STRATTON_173 [Erwinia phage vB_EamM_Stratton]